MATETKQDHEEENHENAMEISLEDIDVEWERQMELKRAKARPKSLMVLLSPESLALLWNTYMTFDPLSLELLDDDSAFRIGAYLKMQTFPATKLALNVYTQRITLRAAQAFVNGLKRSRVTYVKLSLRRDATYDPATGRDAWQLIAEGALDTVQQVHFENGMLDPIVDRIGTHLVGNTSLQKLLITIHAQMTEYGAMRLADGVHEAHITQIELIGGTAFFPTTYGARKIICQAVPRSVQELTVSYGLEDSDALAIGEALVGNTTLKALSIALGEYLTEECALVLANRLCQSQVARFEMQGRVRSPGCRDAQEIMYRDGIQHSPFLQHLCLGGYGLSYSQSESFVLCLPRLLSLEMDLQFYQDQHRNYGTLFESLVNATQLQSLKLKQPLEASEWMHFSTTLLHLSSLTHLAVKGNLTCDEGPELVNRSKNRNNPGNYDRDGNFVPLQYWELESYNIHGFAAWRLMEAVAEHPCLVHLDLSGSTDIGFSGLSMIGYLLQSVRLQELCLDQLSSRKNMRTMRKCKMLAPLHFSC